MTRCGVWNVRRINLQEIDRANISFVGIEALQRIVGVVPAFMRPRKSRSFSHLPLLGAALILGQT